ncbi:CapA family protein [Chloroflexota bacterium]|nr:CapA family protein [Chloroflexota bacterium]
MKRRSVYLGLIGIVVLLSGCYRTANLTPAPLLPTTYAQILQTLTPGTDDQITNTTPEPEPQVETLWIHPGIPESCLAGLDLAGLTLMETADEADLRINTLQIAEGVPSGTIWTYVLAAPFYTITDGLSLASLRSIWQGQALAGFEKVVVTERTSQAMALLLGEPSTTTVEIVDSETLQSLAISDDPLLTILPFEDLSPIWKVLRVDGISPIDSDYSPETYALSLIFALESSIEHSMALPPGNYHPDKRTVLVMTGVTALTRATAYMMEINGNTFPGTDIQQWMTSADLTHISNEVPFAANCPSPNPNQENLIFCSSTDRIDLLEYVGTDIIELTGNHMLDYGVAAMNLTIEMYEERGWTYYAGGWDLTDAQTARKITHNGNNLAFIGCNPVGPTSDFATASQPGSAPCGDYGWILEAIAEVRAEGYLPIVTLQYAEDYTAVPSAKMIADFKALADAGAVVVNGSQAHTPKVMTFYNDAFLHYGLGNLFFDQMNVYYGETYMPNTRDEFIDRLVFYDNELISVELLTAELEDYARPRPMTTAERQAFLDRIFNAAQGYLE